MSVVTLYTTRYSTLQAFGNEASTAGATFNVYTAGTDGIFTSVLPGVTAGPRDPSLESFQTFGAVRKLARYVKIEGVPGSGGEFSISEVWSVGNVTAGERHILHTYIVFDIFIVVVYMLLWRAHFSPTLESLFAMRMCRIVHRQPMSHL